LEFLHLLPALAAVSFVVISRPPSWLFAMLFAVPAIWLGQVLSLGGGVQSRGLGMLVAYGLPGLSLVVGYLAHRACRTRSRLLLVPLGFALAFALHMASRRFYPRTYAEVHDYLFGVEALLIVAAVAAVIVRPLATERPRWMPVVWSLALLVPGLLASRKLFELTPAPVEALRAIYGRSGFHLARLSRWRGRLSGSRPETPRDDQVLDALRLWDNHADAFETRLDELLPDRRRLNLLMITIDTLRPDRLGCFGGKDLTPNIDALGARGVVFRRTWAQYPSTHFSSESLFHGRYPTASRLWRTMTRRASSSAISKALPTLLAENGLRTGAAIAFTDAWLEGPVFKESMRSFELVNPDRRGAPAMDAEYFVDSARSALDQFEGDRFFLWVHLFEPHHPYLFHEGITEGDDDQARYDGEVRYADREVGRLLDHLRAKGLSDDTIVVLASDHGEAFGEHGGHYHASSLYEEQIRVPMIVAVPGVSPHVVEQPVEVVDLHGTLQRLMDLQIRTTVQSTDLSPLIVEPGRHEDRFPGIVLAELPNDVKELSAAATNLAAIVRDGWKLIRHLDEGWSELYDLTTDPHETIDLASKEPDRKRALEAALRSLLDANERFDRPRPIADERAESRDRVEAALIATDPFQRSLGVSEAGARGLEELGPDILAMAADESEFGEIRYQAFNLAAEWQVEGWRKVLRDFAHDENPVLRWAANRVAAGPKGETQALLRELDFLWRRGERGLWTQRLRERLGDRYLSPDVKRVALGELRLLPLPVTRYLAMHLLAGWDPGFDHEVRESLRALLAEPELEALARARRELTNADEAVAQARHQAAVEAFDRSLAALPAQTSALPIQLRRLESLCALADPDRTLAALDQLEDALADEQLARRGEYWSDIERRVDEIRSWDPSRGLLPESLAVKITGIVVEPSAFRFVWPGQTFKIKLRIDHEGDRGLPGGDWCRSARIRVIWSQYGKEGETYGSEGLLDRGLLPGEHDDYDLTVMAPQVPGGWLGRVIINQQDGARFHVHEGTPSVFGITVFDPDLPIPPGTLSAGEIHANFAPEVGVEDWILSDEALWVMGVCTTYNASIISRPFVFKGQIQSLFLEMGWLSTVEGADVVRLEFVPMDGAPEHPPQIVHISRDGEHGLTPPLAFPKLEGRYRLRLMIGVRQGTFEIMKLTFQ
ncbi:MAG: sulfatase, partial [Planctomycetes bacterium]|nr:sulfatase [Planctomycetota bacterium]